MACSAKTIKCPLAWGELLNFLSCLFIYRKASNYEFSITRSKRIGKLLFQGITLLNYIRFECMACVPI
jgi:hypothetical protein